MRILILRILAGFRGNPVEIYRYVSPSALGTTYSGSFLNCVGGGIGSLLIQRVFVCVWVLGMLVNRIIKFSVEMDRRRMLGLEANILICWVEHPTGPNTDVLFG